MNRYPKVVVTIGLIQNQIRLAPTSLFLFLGNFANKNTETIDRHFRFPFIEKKTFGFGFGLLCIFREPKPTDFFNERRIPFPFSVHNTAVPEIFWLTEELPYRIKHALSQEGRTYPQKACLTCHIAGLSFGCLLELYEPARRKSPTELLVGLIATWWSIAEGAAVLLELHEPARRKSPTIIVI